MKIVKARERGGSKQGELLDLREIGSSLLVGRTMLPEIWQGLCPGWIGRGTAKEEEEEEMVLVRGGRSSMEISQGNNIGEVEG